MYLSELKIKNFRQFGADEPVFSVQFHEGVTALVGENDAALKGNYLLTEKSYSDFVIEFDVRWKDGVMPRGIDTGLDMRTPRIQLQLGVSGSLRVDMTGSFYTGGKPAYPEIGQAKDAKKLMKPEGEWNTFRIEAKGDPFGRHFCRIGDGHRCPESDDLGKRTFMVGSHVKNDHKPKPTVRRLCLKEQPERFDPAGRSSNADDPDWSRRSSNFLLGLAPMATTTSGPWSRRNITWKTLAPNQISGPVSHSASLQRTEERRWLCRIQW